MSSSLGASAPVVWYPRPPCSSPASGGLTASGARFPVAPLVLLATAAGAGLVGPDPGHRLTSRCPGKGRRHARRLRLGLWPHLGRKGRRLRLSRVQVVPQGDGAQRVERDAQSVRVDRGFRLERTGKAKGGCAGHHGVPSGCGVRMTSDGSPLRKLPPLLANGRLPGAWPDGLEWDTGAV